jgi:hypothetical protein
VKKQNGGIIMLHDARDSPVRMEAVLAANPNGEFNRAWIPDVVEEIITVLLERGCRLNGFDALSVLPIGGVGSRISLEN